MEYLYDKVRRRVRQIDYVTVKGSQQPMGLFTYDVSLERVPSPNQGTYIAYTAAALTRRDSLMSQVSGVGSVADGRSANAAELLDDDVISFSMSAYNWEYSDHPDLACTWAVDEAFLGLFAQGFSAYREGSWLQAKQILEQTKFMRRTLLGQPLQDGPSNTLLNFMAGHDYTAPFTWKGYRELTDK
ncbi:hypothetical protein CVIRNUC_003073 [Coccomyxa viridis]|uniref:Uncharacterized protein n=1 Tax=Coccomyxa viridis TaxID=1274662 RepID=A0AAV1HY04_9CHLO|nr:hypothetical protein CVIRNUC_003073 [Coccomyxa viridis]